VRRTSFNIFASQGDGRRIMQATTRKVMNRKIDTDILAELQNATQTTGAAVTASLNLVSRPKTILGNNCRRRRRRGQHVRRHQLRLRRVSDADPGVHQGVVRRDQAVQHADQAVPPLGRHQLDRPPEHRRARAPASNTASSITATPSATR
jgi:hypothetical protein